MKDTDSRWPGMVTEEASTAAFSIATPPGNKPFAPRPVTPPDLKPFQVLGSYQVIEHLGGGGMAEVYVARSLLGQGIDKRVALKVVRPAFGPHTRQGAMFLDEARISATLQHPNIVQVFDFGEAQSRSYLAMELVDGRDLIAVLRELHGRRTPAPPTVAVTIAIAMCRALEYVHEKRDLDGRPLNLVHRDVGPANVLVSAHNEVKLMDFGVAASERTAIEGGLVVGKLPYMLPEQFKGEAPSPQWDLYPVGVTLHQLLTLQHPYQGNPAEYLLMESLRFHRGAASLANPAVPPALDELVLKATQLDPAQRFPSARALREALEAVAAQLGPGDVGAWVNQLFGEALKKDAARYEELTAEARRRTTSRMFAPLAAVRRKVVYSAPYRQLARRPALLKAVWALTLALVIGGGVGGTWWVNDRRALREGLARADAEVVSGRLLGAQHDGGLDVLLELQRRWPREPRVQRRLSLLAARFEALGRSAFERDNLEEAAAHLEAALQAEPSRASAGAALEAAKEAARSRSKDKVVQTP